MNVSTVCLKNLYYKNDLMRFRGRDPKYEEYCLSDEAPKSHLRLTGKIRIWGFVWVGGERRQM